MPFPPAGELRRLLPYWVLAVALPAVPILFGFSDEAPSHAMSVFFLGCTILTSVAFRKTVPADRNIWRQRWGIAVSALLAAATIFSAWFLLLVDRHDLAAVLLAFAMLIPAICLAPYLTWVTGKYYAGIVFTLMLVLGLKLFGGLIVVLVYGWNAVDYGHMRMTWLHPNLLVWLFCIGTAIASGVFHRLGAKKIPTKQ